MDNFLLDKSNIDNMERQIAPPMRHVITIPVLPNEGIVVYVGASAFRDGPGEQWQVNAVREIARRLTLTE